MRLQRALGELSSHDRQDKTFLNSSTYWLAYIHLFLYLVRKPEANQTPSPVSPFCSFWSILHCLNFAGPLRDAGSRPRRRRLHRGHCPNTVNQSYCYRSIQTFLGCLRCCLLHEPLGSDGGLVSSFRWSGSFSYRTRMCTSMRSSQGSNME
ncbi:hypothetical protein BKA64DRAFT_26983 [Cadophora sp. MPI-SDFR-AT-0126]|nr:hypothetical protein BKA64DRAFT_26983 [Leotiomycetes sp. MPI-SDFR-AT-0126]